MAGADAGANAGTAALAVPEEGKTRGGDAAIGAAGSLGGSAIGGLVKGASSATYQSFLNFADRTTGGLDKIIPDWAKNTLGLDSLFYHHVPALPAVAVQIPRAVNYLARTDAGKAALTARPAAVNQGALSSTIDYLSQVGAGAAEGAKYRSRRQADRALAC